MYCLFLIVVAGRLLIPFSTSDPKISDSGILIFIYKYIMSTIHRRFTVVYKYIFFLIKFLVDSVRRPVHSYV